MPVSTMLKLQEDRCIMNKLIIYSIIGLILGCATVERNTDYIKATDEPKSDYVPAPPRITPDSGPTVSALEGEDKTYDPVKVKGIKELQHRIYYDKIG